MNLNIFLKAAQHGAMPGASDEFLGVFFLIVLALTGWRMLRHH